MYRGVMGQKQTGRKAAREADKVMRALEREHRRQAERTANTPIPDAPPRQPRQP